MQKRRILKKKKKTKRKFRFPFLWTGHCRWTWLPCLIRQSSNKAAFYDRASTVGNTAQNNFIGSFTAFHCDISTWIEKQILTTIIVEYFWHAHTWFFFIIWWLICWFCLRNRTSDRQFYCVREAFACDPLQLIILGCPSWSGACYFSISVRMIQSFTFSPCEWSELVSASIEG